MNGVEKHETETTETIEGEEHRAAGKPVAKARPRLKPAVTLTSVSIPLCERNRIDVNPVKYHDDCFVSKAMIRLLRHDQSVHQEDDWAVRFGDILEEFKKKKFVGALHWPIERWTSTLAKGGGPKRWLSSSRATRTRNPSFWTWNRRARSTSSARNRRSSQPTWTTLRSSNFSRLLPCSNVLTAISTGKSALFIALVEDV